MEQEMMKLDQIMIKYISALKVLETQLEIINDDFKYIKEYNPIEHIKSRIKSADSIINKLQKNGYEFSIENVEKHINDIVGVRIICTFEYDIMELVDIIRKSSLIKVIKEKDYIRNPKEIGYRSYHLIVEVPVEMINEKVNVRAEIQIRTLAMDLWASLEHKLCYKSRYCTSEIEERLTEISDELNVIDLEMNELLIKEQEIRRKVKGDLKDD
ncbi:MAG: GTP pyrophosphokinase family protein [Bacilli bacterium]|nr:GTP pyrophosphokinase family protein [Bacilli bacterium]